MKPILLFYLTLATFANAYAQQDFATRKKHFNIESSGLAIQGYDPVSYFTSSPIKGKSDIYLYYNGVKYLFASQQNLQTFKLNPTKYEPTYGGWCAYAMGQYGEKVEVDPLKYKIVDGKLNLFYYSIINNTLNKWNEKESELKPLADKNWAKIIKQ
ncbi:MAG: YHS domain-containing protein [Bacteroidia bacterium]|jgi:YHS domain-containing protein|nr:YHS domain-containing protein [Bacteroidia bacterium]